MSVYEQIKDDLGYLQLDRAAEVFATLAEDARAQDWTHVEFLGRLIAEQADAPPATGASPPGCDTPGSPSARRSASSTSTSNPRSTGDSSRTSPPCGS